MLVATSVAMISQKNGGERMDRTNQVLWAVIGVVLFLACYVEAMRLFQH